MRWVAILLAAGAMAGCGTRSDGLAPTSRLSACPPGQFQLRTAQVFLGTPTGNEVRPEDLKRFVDDEVRPRFPDGVTIVEGGERWAGVESPLLRESAKVVMIMLPSRGDPIAEVEAVRTAYKARFHHEAAVVLPPPTCADL
jgi:hypothetical protein